MPNYNGVWSLSTQLQYVSDWPVPPQRGIMGGGRTSAGNTNVIQFINITTLGNAADFGDRTVTQARPSALSSATRGVFVGGQTGSTIDYITIATTGNATDFGDLNNSLGGTHSYGGGSVSNGTRGVTHTATGSNRDTLQYITIASTGDAADFGNLTVSRRSSDKACNSTTRGCIAGGVASSQGSDVIDYITTASTGNATDFGNLSVGRSEGGGGGNSVRGVFGGGSNASQDAVNTIDYITIASTGNASDFGDLLATNTGTIGALSGTTRLVFCGGYLSTNARTDVMQSVEIATTGNSTDFGDLLAADNGVSTCGVSDAHGGLS